jgi:integrase
VDANGRRRYVSGKTKPEVRQKLRRLLADGDQGIAYDSENLTVEAYLDRWLEAIRGLGQGPHVGAARAGGPAPPQAATLGGGRLDRLDTLQAQAVYGRKLEAGFSPRTVQIVHAMLHKALKQAVAWTLVPRNVAEAATPPRRSRASKSSRSWKPPGAMHARVATPDQPFSDGFDEAFSEVVREDGQFDRCAPP